MRRYHAHYDVIVMNISVILIISYVNEVIHPSGISFHSAIYAEGNLVIFEVFTAIE